MPLPRDGDAGPGAAGSAVLPVRPALPPALPRVRHPGTGLTSGGDGEISEENPGAAGRARTAPAGPGTPQRPVSAPGRPHARPRVPDPPTRVSPRPARSAPRSRPSSPRALRAAFPSPPHARPSGRVPAPFSPLRRCGALRGRAVRTGKQSGAGPGRGKGGGGCAPHRSASPPAPQLCAPRTAAAPGIVLARKFFSGPLRFVSTDKYAWKRNSKRVTSFYFRFLSPSLLLCYYHFIVSAPFSTPSSSPEQRGAKDGPYYRMGRPDRGPGGGRGWQHGGAEPGQVEGWGARGAAWGSAGQEKRAERVWLPFN